MPFRHVLVTKESWLLNYASRGVSTFSPLISRTRHRTDRQKLVEFPLFSGYLFAQIAVFPEIRRTVLLARGVAGFVAMRGEPLPNPRHAN